MDIHAITKSRVGRSARRAGRPLAALAMVVTLAAAAGCSLSGGGSDGADVPLVLVTHDSFSLSDGVLDGFTEQTGVAVEVRSSGDAGKLASELVLTKDDPLGDVAFGIDNTFASRVIGQGVFAPYVSPAAQGGAQDYAVPGSDELTAVDYGDVCLNIDTGWFDRHGVAPPATITDLTRPEYRDLTVVENPATSSPGLAFLLATIVTQNGGPGRPDAPAQAEGWQDYWRALRDNGVKVVDGWTQAYTVEFSGSSGHGPRPIVVSYASSPPVEAGADGSAPDTRAVVDSCFRQVEYAGVLSGTDRPDAARELVDFLLSPAVQQDLPGQMYVFPVQRDTPLPQVFAEYAAQPAHPLSMDPARIGENRDAWIRQWRDIVLG
ncbi:thiamine ABC transporter substrate-binding protein [Tomitella fengzijianii]|uniref:Thiamine ABC transporter substrate-binding protein n=1 Tax=Tomitella fengzijianii TaxID=2597660 RepID=A0A516X2B0_9ACTN|nr:thiamine ABC transporter substrate-binding protein [Tomitella fengzijianii]QDQ97218.1 thiamine ABC transporter substrate-binding protein [Tomitella fengzijianii]